MAGSGHTLNYKYLVEDQLGCFIGQQWQTFQTRRQNKIAAWEEIRQYLYATDTTQTTNSKLPWKNKTTVPKLCQIRDNLHANYMASMFPKRKSHTWEADEKDSNSVEKRDSILNYSYYWTRQPAYYNVMSQLVYDFIDYGNVFPTVEWVDSRQELPDKTQIGYVGPLPRRVSPLDLNMNPISSTFEKSPKIVRDIMTMGDIKEMLTRLSTDTDRETYENLWNYLKDLRLNARAYVSNSGDDKSKDKFFQMDGFDSFQAYLESDYVEVLTFYGDIYDYEKDEFLRNHVITVVDRHKVVDKKPNPSYFGYPPIFHCGWRPRQDNLWAMGPLDNLVGMQYRIDHIENLKADVFDLIAFPPLKVKGYVDDFQWGPFARIYTGEEGDVEIMAPPFQVLADDQQIDKYMNRMEEMAGAPKEAMGFRSPGEKTAFEVQRLENAASRIFQAKIKQFEMQVVEPVLNAMLELSRRNLTAVQSIPVFDDEFNITRFSELTPDDIVGTGKIKPVAARHFAEKAEMIQNLNNLFSTPLGQDPGFKMHWSTFGLAKLTEDLLDLKDFELVQKNIRLSEEADAKREAMSHEEQTQMEAQTPSGMRPDDYDQTPAG